MAQIKIFDSTGDTTVGTGTGSLVGVGTAPTGYQTPTAAGVANNDNSVIRIENSTGVTWEDCETVVTVAAGVYTYSRGTLLASSTGSRISFSAGTQNIKFVVPKECLAIGVGTTAGDLFYHDGTKLARLAVGSAGQSLTVISGVPAWVTPATAQANPTNPTMWGTGTSSSFLMMGVGQTITPAKSGTLLATFSIGVVTGRGNQIEINYGTGSAPANQAAVTGTTIGAVQTFGSTSSTIPGGPCVLQAVVTGLTVGTAYWFDLAMKAAGASNMSFSNTLAICISIVEL